ncbi:glycoside hydrolase family 5 protein [Crassisporium funariophilum]|nr:glycoside hydrolase family 5 protein [Crassisporium funariophilum]
MPLVPSISPATGRRTSEAFIHTVDCNFVDNAGRTLLLRGVNLSGASKAPVGQLSHQLDGFWESAEQGGLSFVGRPLNIDDGSADVHLARLRGWGFNFLRFPVTWEALEHEGPGKYDFEFMDYTIRVLCKCRDYGFRVYMDPHQDTWSRFSGGSGAPFWTLPACGINPHNITATQAAILHCEYTYPTPAALPAMAWSTNYGRLFSQSLFTFFFAGRDFAPNCIIDGVNIQDYLQSHYIEAFGQLADRIAAFEGGSLLEQCVVGWDSMNEPFEGWCGWEDLNLNPTEQGSTLKKGTYPTPAQSLRLGMGTPQTVDNWSFGTFGPARDGTVTIDPKGHKLWADADPSDEGEGERPDGTHPRWGWKRDVSKWPLGTCPWAQHGVWDVTTGFILLPDYFLTSPSSGLPVDFITTHWLPHFLSFAQRIRRSQPESILFVQPPVFGYPPHVEEEVMKGRGAYSAHYYDGLTLVTRHWNWFNADALGLLRGRYTAKWKAVKVGEGAIRRSLEEQIGYLKEDALIIGGASSSPSSSSGPSKPISYPTIIGEIGTPFDMDDKKAYRTGDFSAQEKALDASLNAADGTNGVGYTVWGYVAEDQGHEWGDGWNGEDLSIWSGDDMRDLRMSLPMTAAGAASSLSLATLGGSSALSLSLSQPSSSSSALKHLPSSSSSLSSSSQQYDPRTGHSPNPYDFLTNGARAVRAFARPWPVKVVGRVKEVRFEIGRASFRLVVGVRAEDRVREGVSGEGQEEEEEQLATEVYIPLVHYAHPDIIERSVMMGYGGGPGPRRGSSGPGRGLKKEVDADADTRSIASDIKTKTPYLIPNTPDLLALDVTVSHGHFSVQGQTLKWWYDVPGEGEEEREYVLEVRRRGGVIKPRVIKNGVLVEGGDGICGDLCEEGGCVVG